MRVRVVKTDVFLPPVGWTGVVFGVNSNGKTVVAWKGRNRLSIIQDESKIERVG